jgi:hypothetical protein
MTNTFEGNDQGCQMAYFYSKNPNLGMFWRALEWKDVGIFYGHLENITAIWYILQPFDTFCCYCVILLCSGLFLHCFWCIVSRKIWQHLQRLHPKLNYSTSSIDKKGIFEPPPAYILILFLMRWLCKIHFQGTRY